MLKETLMEQYKQTLNEMIKLHSKILSDTVEQYQANLNDLVAEHEKSLMKVIKRSEEAVYTTMKKGNQKSCL